MMHMTHINAQISVYPKSFSSPILLPSYERALMFDIKVCVMSFDQMSSMIIT
jgi:hypothetical protein